MTKENSHKAAVSGHSLGAIRYAAYAVSDRAYVFLKMAGKKFVEVVFTPRKGVSVSVVRSAFLSELADEKLRERVSDGNRGLREFLVLKALSTPEKSSPEPAEAGLTAEQEKELEDLIAQVEREIKRESGGKQRDPLGITRTWEDKYGSKKTAKK